MTNLIVNTFVNRVPLNYQQADGKQITIYCREVYRPENSKADRLVYLQGGPGFPPTRDLESCRWLEQALQRFRVILPDQRGTGRSTAVTSELCETIPDPVQLSEYLSCFRADNIVRDLEVVRKNLCPDEPWILCGQSFGGFVSCTYLSFAPEALKGVIITGGLPPLGCVSVKDVYRATLELVYKRNQEFYQHYPDDVDKVKRIINTLRLQNMDLGGGDWYTPERLLDSGMVLGTTGGMRKLHYALFDPFTGYNEDRIRWSFATKIKEQNYETNPIFVFLHESIYCDGSMSSNWACNQLMDNDDRFSLDNEDFICFRGECIRRGMFDEYRQLQPFKAAAEILAKKDDWPRLYDFDQLGKNTVPVEAIVYETDFYVDMKNSLQAAKMIKGTNVWIHPTFQHDSIHTNSDEVLNTLCDRLLARL